MTITVDINYVDADQTIRLEVPFDWNQYQIAQYIGELARQGAATFSQLPHYVPKGFKEVDFGEDAAKFVESKRPRDKGGK